MPSTQNEQPLKSREERVTSHTLAELKKYRWLPFFTHSAVLLDISRSGFKLELTGEAHVEPNTIFWLNIPLTPMGIMIPKQVTLKVQCKWFDNKRYRMGGVFANPDQLDQKIMDEIIHSIKDRGLK
jgi:hypothetical protein